MLTLDLPNEIDDWLPDFPYLFYPKLSTRILEAKEPIESTEVSSLSSIPDTEWQHVSVNQC